MILSNKLNNIKLMFGLLCIFQAIIWNFTSHKLPYLGIIDRPPSVAEAQFISLGEDALYFRIGSIVMQNAGDSFGRFTALRDYDYKILLEWLQFLDKFDAKSTFLPSISSYYYSNTQKISDNIYLIKYLEQYYERNPQKNWWWMSQAVHIALHKMRDRSLALSLALKLAKSDNPALPYWARQMPAFILEQMGEKEQAYIIIKDILSKYSDYSQDEANFMNFFIKERLGILSPPSAQ